MLQVFVVPLAPRPATSTSNACLDHRSECEGKKSNTLDQVLNVGLETLLEEILERGDEKMEGGEKIGVRRWIDGFSQGKDGPPEREQIGMRTFARSMSMLQFRIDLIGRSLFLIIIAQIFLLVSAEDFAEHLGIFLVDDRRDVKGVLHLVDLLANVLGKIGHVLPFVELVEEDHQR